MTIVPDEVKDCLIALFLDTPYGTVCVTRICHGHLGGFKLNNKVASSKDGLCFRPEREAGIVPSEIRMQVTVEQELFYERATLF